jgi:putative tryptophan/tyrosine transport system substrate-binding protein
MVRNQRASTMTRREFVTLVGGAAIAWPFAARAQQPDGLRRVGVLMGWSEGNSEFRGFVATFMEELARLGWTDGRNVRFEQRWTDADVNRTSAFAKELVAAQPDVILTSTTPVTTALHSETNTIPIVFTIVSDPVGAGLVAGLPHPGGNVTGFTHTDAALGGKWLGLLKEVAPGIKRAGIMFNPDTAPGSGKFFLGSIEAAARSLAVEPVIMRVRSDAEIEAAIAALGREQAGLAAMDDSFMAVHQRTLIFSSARHNCRRSSW